MDNPDPNKDPDQYHSPVIFLFVFFSGFASLATEIIGPRLFSSLFGYTTQIWAAIISVTLLGISVGYYLGRQSSSPKDFPIASDNFDRECDLVVGD